VWFHELSINYTAYENGILPESGGLNAQPALYPSLMGFMSVAINGENDKKRADMEKGRKGGTNSATENYLENNPTAATNVSPDSPAAVPGLFAPRNIIGRN
jgi:hypothetical protein